MDTGGHNIINVGMIGVHWVYMNEVGDERKVYLVRMKFE